MYETPTHAEKALRVESSEDSDIGAIQRGRCQALGSQKNQNAKTHEMHGALAGFLELRATVVRV